MVYTSYNCMRLQRADLVRDISGLKPGISNIAQKAGLYFDRDGGAKQKSRDNKVSLHTFNSLKSPF